MDSFEKTIHVNADDHITGRLAAVVAKNLLLGCTVHVHGCERLIFPFGKERARSIYQSYRNKRCLVNPRKGPFHYVEPSKYFRLMVRGMLPHKKTRGENALKRLHCYETLEAANSQELMAVPKATRKFKQNPIRKNYPLGDLMRDFGWKHYNQVKLYNEEKDPEIQNMIAEAKNKKERIELARESHEVQKEVSRRIQLFY